MRHKYYISSNFKTLIMFSARPMMFRISAVLLLLSAAHGSMGNLEETNLKKEPVDAVDLLRMAITRLDQLETRMQDMEKLQLDGIQRQGELGDTVRQLENRIQNIEVAGPRRLETEIAFSAIHGPDDVVYNEGTTINFVSVVVNMGGAYDSTTSAFNCPVKGVYYFATHVRTNAGDRFILTGTTMASSGDGQSYSLSNVYECEAGEAVVVTAGSDLTIIGQDPAMFNGFLLRQL